MRLRSSTKFKGPITRSQSRRAITNAIGANGLRGGARKTKERQSKPVSRKPSAKARTTKGVVTTYKMSVFPTKKINAACFLTTALTNSLPSKAYASASTLSRSSQPFRIGGVPGKGQGIIATRHITVATLILAEAPLIVVPGQIDLKRIGIASARSMETMLSQLLQLLPKHRQDLYIKLHDAHAGKGVLNGIFETNCFMLSHLGDKSVYDSYNGVFNKLSKPNHSCSPNAHYRWDDATFTMQLRAVRDIGVGEEIVISYTDILQSSSVRFRDLKEDYGFPCACRACCNAVASDASRKSFQRMEFGSTGQDRISSHYLEDRLRVLGLMEEEGVEATECYPKLLREILVSCTNRLDRPMVVQFKTKYLLASAALGVPVDSWILEL